MRADRVELLDRPVWASLTSLHAGLAQGGALAKRYLPEVNRFASARDDSDEALAALAALVQLNEPVFVLQVPEIRIPPGLMASKTAKGVQMVAAAPLVAETGPDDVVSLGDADAPEMLALATLTQPGPFLRQTHRMGHFVGIRIDGRLAAMAGERFRFPGCTEVSGVCTHPDFQGRGLAGHLSRHVAAGIAARGDTAFLHAWKTNTAAIRLYEKLGFRLRCEVNVAVLERAARTD
ncbi:GNAT family N-acetyltransferase [Rhodanobacter sp. DHG33]|uniref:GNAT family N-acetyltransferase n=1 Tax=Rhodanobacter sp. DHG33 TaxID=2775921 RepID=UPI001786779C|nr:GNAT family N-acetyltransferase [Rhodanobacter sp. DHG33]MBD8897801.1 GNAT family N-acetyltransferase [Rhodanobacter sp. DHG33]